MNLSKYFHSIQRLNALVFTRIFTKIYFDVILQTENFNMGLWEVRRSVLYNINWYTCTCIRQFVGYFKIINGGFEILSPILRDLKYTQKYMRFDICIEIINKLETRCPIWTIGEWPIYEYKKKGKTLTQQTKHRKKFYSFGKCP